MLTIPQLSYASIATFYLFINLFIKCIKYIFLNRDIYLFPKYFENELLEHTETKTREGVKRKNRGASKRTLTLS